jgi:hypothetical protein
MLEEQKPTGLGAWSNGLAREQPDERRDIQRTINLWRRHVTDDGLPPLLSTCDVSAMKGDWGHRFLICSDPSIENAAFIIYGIKLAELLDLPARVTASIPLLQLVPERYRPVFTDGCRKSMTESAPAKFSGSSSRNSKAELYRAVFLPIRLHPNWSKRLVFGSFNYRIISATQKTE